MSSARAQTQLGIPFRLFGGSLGAPFGWPRRHELPAPAFLNAQRAELLIRAWSRSAHRTIPSSWPAAPQCLAVVSACLGALCRATDALENLVGTCARFALIGHLLEALRPPLCSDAAPWLLFGHGSHAWTGWATEAAGPQQIRQRRIRAFQISHLATTGRWEKAKVAIARPCQCKCGPPAPPDLS